MAGLDLFGFLTGISPWTWIAFGVALGALEMALMSFFLIWPGLAAVLVGVVLWMFPEMSGSGQVALFAALGAGLTFGGRAFLRRVPETPSDQPDLNRRSNALVGRSAKVLEPFAGGEGAVEIDGVRWRARWAGAQTPQPEAWVRIEAVDGMILEVGPVGASAA